MPKFYCDYCDVYLTHDSPSVRRLHNDGWKHKTNVRSYYAQFLNNEEVIAKRKKLQKKKPVENPIQAFTTNLPFVPKHIKESLLKAPSKPKKVELTSTIGKAKFVTTQVKMNQGGFNRFGGRGNQHGRGRGGYRHHGGRFNLNQGNTMNNNNNSGNFSNNQPRRFDPMENPNMAFQMGNPNAGRPQRN